MPHCKFSTSTAESNHTIFLYDYIYTIFTTTQFYLTLIYRETYIRFSSKTLYRIWFKGKIFRILTRFWLNLANLIMIRELIAAIMFTIRIYFNLVDLT